MLQADHALRLAVITVECQLPEEYVPTYQYRCTACGKDHEAVQSFSDAALTECPACGGGLRKVFGAVGVVFKGSGFYKTDSRSNGAAGKSRESGDASSGSSADSSTKESVKASKDSTSSGSGDSSGGGSSSSSSTGTATAA
jgi:putative FmdB family regulatory protein